MNKARSNPVNAVLMHGALIFYTVIALFPVFVILINSLKDRKAIFKEPLALPTPDSFSLIGYQTVLKQGDFFLYFQNSMIVTVVSLALILLFGAMAAFALSEYRSCDFREDWQDVERMQAYTNLITLLRATRHKPTRSHDVKRVKLDMISPQFVTDHRLENLQRFYNV